MSLKITEDKRSDISTVIAYYANPTEKWPNGQFKVCETWSCFWGQYSLNQEREFIKELEDKNPGVYSHFHISWSRCN